MDFGPIVTTVCSSLCLMLTPLESRKVIWPQLGLLHASFNNRAVAQFCLLFSMWWNYFINLPLRAFYSKTSRYTDIGAIFLCRFRLYVLSFMFRFMFANICFEKNQNSKIHVMFIINITWNETWNNQLLPFASMLC